MFLLNEKESGFTLIELLLVLLVVSVLSVILIPSMMRTVQNIQTDHFFKIMDSDILYVQNQSLGKEDYLRIVFNEDHYMIVDAIKGGITRRAYPSHLSLSGMYMISFSSSGSVRNAGSFLLADDQSNYQVTFPLGKGRHYIEAKQ